MATTTDYTYSADGERTEETVSGSPTVTASYNGAEELTAYDDTAADMTAATYDGDGVRASSTTSSGTTSYVWDEARSLPRLLMDSTYAYVYGPDSTPFEEVKLSAGTISYLVTDALGSVRGIVSSGGSLTASTAYAAFGAPETTGGLMSYTPFGFAGGYTDPTGLIYLLNRYYDTSTGQFLSVDPDVATTGEAYAYTSDDPVNALDPDGLFCWGLCSFTEAASDVGHFVVTHKVVIGLGLGVLAIVTGGAGLIAAGAYEASTTAAVLGATAFATGAGAAAIDGGECARNPGVNTACAAALLGGLGALSGAPELAVVLGWISESEFQGLLALSIAGIFLSGLAVLIDDARYLYDEVTLHTSICQVR